MTTIWNYRGDDRALWAVIAAIVGSYVLAMRLARWDATWQWVPLALPVAVLLIWFFLAEAGVRDLGFPAPRDRGSAAAGPLASTPCQACKAMPAGTGACASGASPSQHSTCRRSGQSPSTGARLASRAADVISTWAPASCRICATCVGLSSGFTGTSTAPAAGAAKLATTVSTRLSRYNTTRAPRSSPSCSKAAAQPSIWACKSA